jgi:diguanylate cyclase (GGDEF)-like protein
MKLHILRLPRLLAERRISAVFGMLIIVMLWAGIFARHLEEVRVDQRDAERTIQNLATIFEENVLRSIGEIDKVLLYLRRSVESRRGSAAPETSFNSAGMLSDIVARVAILDAKGILRASSYGSQPAPPLDMSDREHFQVQVNSNEDRLFIGKPRIGSRTGRWSVEFSRRFLDRNGAFAGVVVAGLDPIQLTRAYYKVDLGSDTSILLIGDDGVVRSSAGKSVGDVLGRDVSGTELASRSRANDEMTFEYADPIDSEARLTTIRHIKGYPLWASVSINRGDVFKNSWSTLKVYAIAGILLTLIVLAAMERMLRTESKASQKAEQLRLTLEHMNQGIMLVTRDQHIPIINGRCAELLDLPPGMVGHPPRFDDLIKHQAAVGGAADGLIPSPQSVLDLAGAGQVSVCECKTASGKVIEVRSDCLPDGGVLHTFADITKRCEAEAHIARLAAEDPLTGLPNRRVFSAALDQISGRRTASESDPEFAVLFLDLDRFKAVNDTLGHRIGDLLLQEVAKRLEWSLGSNSVLARLGGDEFAVIVPTFVSRAALEASTLRLAKAVSEPYELDGHRVCTNVSIGIAVGPGDGETVDDLLMAADLALYAVKAGGRGTYRFYDRSMNQELSDRRQIEMDLREAVARNELLLYYQPIINLQRNVVTGFEALARWRHPVRGMIPPSVFITVAEDTGLILPLGEWALTEACRRASEWPESLKVSVNLSPVQFSAPNLTDTIAGILAATGLAPNRLELEITERIFMENTEHTLAVLHRLKDIGVRISMDDFGTGYSSLSYLRSFPFDKIKVDRTFVTDLAKGAAHAAIVQAVVSLARALGMMTTAEGIETSDQQNSVTALGCDEAQGYLFSAPVPFDKIPEILATWSPKRTMAA